jgi:peptide/nickel transport system substrate-binding protein
MWPTLSLKPSARSKIRRLRTWRSTKQSVPERQSSSSDTWMTNGPGDVDVAALAHPDLIFPPMRPNSSASALLLLAGLSVAACSSKDRTSAGGDTGGTMVMVGIGDAIDLFPPLVNEQNARMIQDVVFDRLAEIGPDMITVGDKGFTPRLARSWTWAPDSLSIAFSLDPRARWHDGRPVTAGDVRYTFNVIRDPKLASPIAPVLSNVDSISVRDSLTPVVWFRKHTPEQFYDIAYNLVPVPEHVYGSVPVDQMRTSDKTRVLVGSGRFRFVKWEPKVRLELEADTANYRGRAKLDRIIITPVSDPAAGVTQILSGQADFMESFPIDQVARLDSSKVARGLAFPQLAYTMLGMNVHARKNLKAPHPVLSDIRVRRAIAMGVDRRAMLRNVFGDFGQLAYGPFPKALGAADTTLKLPAYDTTAAKALLDSAGWRPGPDGIRIRNGQKLQFLLETPATSLFRRRYAVLIQEALRKLGAQVDIDVPDNATFMAKTNAADYDLMLTSYGMGPSIADLKQNWTTAAIGAEGLNSLAYSNPKVDALLDTATTTFDAAKAKSAASQAYQTIIDDVPAVFLYDVVQVGSVNRRIETKPVRPDGWWVNLADWSIPADKRIDRDRIGLGAPRP